MESTTDSCGVALQRRQPRIGIARLEARHCRLRRLHAGCDLSLRKAQQQTPLYELLYEVMALVPERVEPGNFDRRGVISKMISRLRDRPHASFAPWIRREFHPWR